MDSEPFKNCSENEDQEINFGDPESNCSANGQDSTEVGSEQFESHGAASMQQNSINFGSAQAPGESAGCQFAGGNDSLDLRAADDSARQESGRVASGGRCAEQPDYWVSDAHVIDLESQDSEFCGESGSRNHAEISEIDAKRRESRSASSKFGSQVGANVGAAGGGLTGWVRGP